MFVVRNKLQRTSERNAFNCNMLAIQNYPYPLHVYAPVLVDSGACRSAVRYRSLMFINIIWYFPVYIYINYIVGFPVRIVYANNFGSFIACCLFCIKALCKSPYFDLCLLTYIRLRTTLPQTKVILLM